MVIEGGARTPRELREEDIVVCFGKKEEKGRGFVYNGNLQKKKKKEKGKRENTQEDAVLCCCGFVRLVGRMGWV